MADDAEAPAAVSGGLTPLPLVSVLFVTYERLQTLAPTLQSFLAATDYPRERLELIVTDDGSSARTLAGIEALGFDRVCTAARRSGLGANVNRGLAAAHGDLVLQLQDDWACVGPSDHLRRAVRILAARPDIGMVILNAHPNDLPVAAHASVGGCTVRIFDNRPDVAIDRVGLHAYTDWPHLKRRAFVAALGPYVEDRPMWLTELDYSRRVNAQRRFFVADIPGMTAFVHIGAALSYNTGPWHGRLVRHLVGLPFGRPLLSLLRAAKRLVVPRAPG